MNGIILLSDVNNLFQTPEVIELLVDKIKTKLGIERICRVNWQSTDCELERGVERLVATGAKTIKVIPLFLTEDTSYDINIPKELRYIASKYYNVEINMEKDMMNNEKFADIFIGVGCKAM